MGWPWSKTFRKSQSMSNKCNGSRYGNIKKSRTAWHWFLYNCGWWKSVRRRYRLEVSLQTLYSDLNAWFSFFLEADSVGTSRAEAATRCLLELNPDVQGDFIDETPEHVMAHTQDFFGTFSVVIATALPEK